jgi:hypothetical protein
MLRQLQLHQQQQHILPNQHVTIRLNTSSLLKATQSSPKHLFDLILVTALIQQETCNHACHIVANLPSLHSASGTVVKQGPAQS